ncbi:MAG: UDP-N-acetylglucosamine 1-carboxyvinyltransferase [Thermaerobacter sp.]|nr:UDP-N-acetylglucosamine 1-carboxyvinyltransferase [Thermaerobacter sp.]
MDRDEQEPVGVIAEPDLYIQGGQPLRGEVRIEASKNAVLPILAATLLTADTVRLPGVPWLHDVDTLCRVQRALGTDVVREGRDLMVQAIDIDPFAAPEHLVRRMRASFLIAGPLLARFGAARVPLPGGCAIGSRPIDLHLKGLVALGADVQAGSGYIEFRAPRLRGATIYLDFPSVGATENLLMAAAMADGWTTIENAAQEPEVVDLANFLCSMGGEVRGAGTAELRIHGVRRLHGADYQVISDRIEAGTYLVATAATGGDVTVGPVLPEHLKPLLAKLREAGSVIDVAGDTVRMRQKGRLKPIDVKTMPHPGFPTDLQAPLMAALSIAAGTSVITETVFENRFMHVSELRRMGADIKIEGRTAMVTGVSYLTGANLHASDLRAAAALVIAALAAEGKSTVADAYHLDRGYAGLEEKFAALGADIERRASCSEVV